MALFQPDYIISWDFSQKDAPIVAISRIRSGKKSTMLEMDVLEQFNTETGVCSLRQLLEEFEERERAKKEVM